MHFISCIFIALVKGNDDNNWFKLMISVEYESAVNNFNHEQFEIATALGSGHEFYYYIKANNAR